MTIRTWHLHSGARHYGSNTDGDHEHESDAGDEPRPRPARKKPQDSVLLSLVSGGPCGPRDFVIPWPAWLIGLCRDSGPTREQVC